MTDTQQAAITDKTRHWLEEVVIGLALCPFAQRVIDQGSLRYCVSSASDTETLTEQLLSEIVLLDQNPEIETTLLIHPQVLADFACYLDYVDTANAILTHLNYEGVYQIASFHPAYIFADSDDSDPANYSNRSPYPMLHLLREASLEVAIASHPDIDGVPEQNVARLRQLGLDVIQQLANGKHSAV